MGKYSSVNTHKPHKSLSLLLLPTWYSYTLQPRASAKPSNTCKHPPPPPHTHQHHQHQRQHNNNAKPIQATEDQNNWNTSTTTA
jgi:hypothetical protein